MGQQVKKKDMGQISNIMGRHNRRLGHDKREKRTGRWHQD
jgi:hypothetical protein